MSKVPIIIDLDRYICTELSELREMYDNRDFSGMKASIERVQQHANAMEEALYKYSSRESDIKRELEKKKTSDKAFRKYVKKKLKKTKVD